jgi:hypothetical protein
MLSEQINGKWRLRPRWFRSENSRVVALFSYRYDAHLVPGLLENIAPVVDGWIAFDDRASTGIFSDEVARRRALIGRARAVGADWVLFIDPDERLERGAAERFRTMTRVTEPVVWGFRIREMYTPDTYRIDGIWGKKQRPSMFRLREGQKFSDQPVHGPCFPIEPAHKRLPSGLNLYHLKMIAPHRREARRNLYKRLDPDNTHQRLGYDYLVEETGAVFEKIPEGRGYRPPHRDDDALWMAELPAEMAR